MWIEYSEDLSVLRVFSRNSFDIAKSKHKICFGKISFPLPLSFDIENVSIPIVDSLNADFFTATIRLGAPVSCDFISSVFSEITGLIEDWTSEIRFRCSACSLNLSDHGLFSNLNQMRPCLLPSATWGFEDMRVCEECGPLVSHSGAMHKKSKGKNFYVGEYELTVPPNADDSSVHCPKCEKEIASSLGMAQRENLKRLGISTPEGESWQIIPKSSALVGYSVLSIFWARMVASDARKIQFGPESGRIFLKFLTGQRDLVVIEEGLIQWGTRVMYTQDISAVGRGIEEFDLITLEDDLFEQIQEELKRLSLHPSLCISKKWITALVKLTPMILEI